MEILVKNECIDQLGFFFVNLSSDFEFAVLFLEKDHKPYKIKSFKLAGHTYMNKDYICI